MTGRRRAAPLSFLLATRVGGLSYCTLPQNLVRRYETEEGYSESPLPLSYDKYLYPCCTRSDLFVSARRLLWNALQRAILNSAVV